MLSHHPPAHKPNVPTRHTKGKHAPSPARSLERVDDLPQQARAFSQRILTNRSEQQIDVRGSTSSSLLTPIPRGSTVEKPQNVRQRNLQVQVIWKIPINFWRAWITSVLRLRSET